MPLVEVRGVNNCSFGWIAQVIGERMRRGGDLPNLVIPLDEGTHKTATTRGCTTTAQ